MCLKIRKSGTGRLALPVSILALTYFGFKRYHAEFYKHLMAKNSYEFIYTTSAIENSGLFQNRMQSSTDADKSTETRAIQTLTRSARN